ncbi:DUF3987 domain-containing protein [Streptomyces sp. ZAF1911]|uniref:DUF3987 domain-containing protein n=1 Tax=Streptomyces sp. ZAF1911 TaxID=2944129 RepID=UPI00237A6FE4|nr:DUF3987 domain-containing protein [Streptomyces sp. ZAF1911]MDD9376535.1 DUF3987 domain-containing protein [Streptomyces sp. ZAF1911]
MQASPGWGAVPSSAPSNCPDGSYYAADAVLERLAELDFESQPDGHEKWVAQCPAHMSNSLKLYISYGDTNPDALLLACHGEGKCSHEQITEALGMSVADLFNRDGQDDAAEEPAAPLYEPPTEKREKPKAQGEPKLIESFEFTDPTGRYLYHAERWEPGRRWNDKAGVWELSGERKSLHFRRKMPDGKTIGSGIFDRKKHADAPPHTIFNAIGVARAVADGEPVFVTEGMSAAKRLMADYEVTATSLDTGAGSEWSPYIAGQLSGAAKVYLLMDADQGGHQWVRNGIAALSGRVGELVVLHPATGMAGDDIVDHLDAGHGLDDLVEVPQASFRTPEEEWPEPPIPLETPELPKLPVHLLGPLAPIVSAVAANKQAPPEYAAWAALGAIDTVVGGQVQVNVKPGWEERQTGKFLMAFGHPSDLKSPSMEDMYDPVRKVVSEYARTVQPFLGDLEKKLPQVPPVPRAIMEDTTFETLVMEISEHGGRMALASDEGGIFKMLGGMYAGKNGGVNDEILRKGYSGAPYDYSRGGSGKRVRAHIPVVKLSMCVLAQPGFIDGIGAANPQFRKSGFLARILYAVPAPLPDYVLDDSAMPDKLVTAHERKIRALFNRFWLAPLPYEFTGAQQGAWETKDGSGAIDVRPPAPAEVWELPKSVRMDFLNFNVDIRKRTKPGGDLTDIHDWAGKLPGSLIRLAVGVTLYGDPRATTFTEESVRNAMALAPYLIEHARAVFRVMEGTDPALEPARRMIARIRSHSTYGEPFTASSINEALRQHGWWSPDRAEATWALLVRYGWVRRVEEPRGTKGGRPSIKYVARPAAYGIAENFDNPVDKAPKGGFLVFLGYIGACGNSQY